MFVKAHQNVERFQAFINEEPDEIALLDFHRFVAFFKWSQRIPPSPPAKRVGVLLLSI
jgi:hypothetical protein